MNDSARRFLIAYDIRSDKRRIKICDCLQACGHRIQYSVFLVDLQPARERRLVMQLENIIDSKEDSILICDIGLLKTAEKCKMTYLGTHTVIDDLGPLII